MKTATIDYEAFGVLLGTGAAMVAQLEAALPTATDEVKQQAQKVLAEVRAALETAERTLVVHEQPKGFQQRLDEAIAAARAKQ